MGFCVMKNDTTNLLPESTELVGMADLLKNALALMDDRPDMVELIYWVLTLDDEVKTALLLAYRLRNEEKKERKPQLLKAPE
jgi:hypothetical protein